MIKKIFYRGCLKDFCYFVGGMIFICLPVIAKAMADFAIFKLGL